MFPWWCSWGSPDPSWQVKGYKLGSPGLPGYPAPGNVKIVIKVRSEGLDKLSVDAMWGSFMNGMGQPGETVEQFADRVRE